jgi:hypothetical protein
MACKTVEEAVVPSHPLYALRTSKTTIMISLHCRLFFYSDAAFTILLTRRFQNLLTDEQLMKILRDQAIFSDGPSARVRSINELATRYGKGAIPVINEIINSVPHSEDEFRAYCRTIIKKIGYLPGKLE